MKFTCRTEYLQRALATAERFTGKNAALPILAHVLLEAEGSLLKITATNLEYAVEIRVPGEGGAPGKATVPVRILNALVQSVREEKMTFEEKRGHLEVRTPARETKINGMNPDDFPLLPRIKSSFSFRVGSAALGSGLGKVLPAVSSSEFKPALTGVFFRVTPDTLFLAATDVFRLAEKKVSLGEKPSGDASSFILPRRPAQEISRIASENDQDIVLSFAENQILAEGDGFRVVSRLVDGAFPEYDAIIPKRFDTTAHLNRTDFLIAVRGSAVFSSKLQDVRLRVEGSTLFVSSRNTDIGEYSVRVPISSSGAPSTLSFNYQYLLDGLAALDEEEVIFGATNDKAVLKNRNDSSFIYLLAPIRLT